DKCNFCAHRLALGQQPACVETCPTGARVFGDLDDPHSQVRESLDAAKKSAVLKPETGAKPKLYYLNSKFINSQIEDIPARAVSELGGEHGR
ncbi:MAG: tetrathionate reductase subunit B, partial [Chloroflexi bacterium]|nr:tetrathionate reductase subunit B [Chloroflexota bacterium]